MNPPSQTTDKDNNSLSAGKRWNNTFSAFKYRNFRLLWISTLFISGGNWVQQITLGWLALELSGSALKVGIVLGLRAGPMLLAPISGAIVDRLDRRKLMLVDQFILAVLALIFAGLVLSDVVVMWHLYAFSAGTGIAWSINNPVRQTLVGNSVPRHTLMNAVALNSMAFNSTRIFGPAAGGLLITFFGPGINFLIQGIFYVAVMIMMFPFRAEYETDHSAVKDESIFMNVREGFRYVLNNRTALTIILVTLIPTLTMMSFVMTLMPVYAVEVLGQEKGEGWILGLLLTATGIGGFLGTLLLAAFSNIKSKGKLIISGLFISSIAILLVSQVNILWMSMVILIFIMGAQMIVMTTNNSVLQMTTPDHMRGRVIGVYMMDIGMMPLGGLIAGTIADLFSVQAALITGSSVALILVILITIMNPSFRKLTV